MKKIILALTSVAVLAISCDNKSKELDEKFTKSMSQTDSLQTVSSEFQTTHDKIVTMHNSMKEKMNTMNPIDSTLMATMAEHEVVFASQTAVLEGQKKMIAGYSEVASKFATLTAEEKEAQINTIIENNAKIIQENENLKSGYEKMMMMHEELMAKLNDTTVVETPEKK